VGGYFLRLAEHGEISGALGLSNIAHLGGVVHLGMLELNDG